MYLSKIDFQLRKIPLKNEEKIGKYFIDHLILQTFAAT